jgi:hypothetical protein
MDGAETVLPLDHCEPAASRETRRDEIKTPVHAACATARGEAIAYTAMGSYFSPSDQ